MAEAALALTARTIEKSIRLGILSIWERTYSRVIKHGGGDGLLNMGNNTTEIDARGLDAQ